MKVILASEVYPPRAGGAGWSTRALALGLREAGHEVRILTTSPGPDRMDDLDVTRLAATGRKRLAVPRAFAANLPTTGRHVVHAQHSLSALGCLAGLDAGRTAVTVRDHWPVCFWSTRISQGTLCPECGIGPMTRCVKGHVPSPMGLAVIPYMRGDLRAKRDALGRAGATLAVSEAIARELKDAGVPRVETIPNIVDVRESLALAAGEPSLALPDEFLLFVGKLEENKGARLLIPAVARAQTGLPLVILGEGSLAHALKFEAASQGVNLILRGWAHRDDVLRTLKRASVLVFPSLWPEPLSRVLLEALALGTPIAAMDTGGTTEILEDQVSGLVVKDEIGLAQAVSRLFREPKLRERLGEGGRRRVEAFSPASLIPQYVSVYKRLL